MSAPALALELAYGSTWQDTDASHVWVNETSLLLSSEGVSTTRGRSTVKERSKIGEISGTLRNEDRHFDKNHAAGPHYGDLIPGVPVRLRATPAGGAARTIARGFVAGFPQRSDPTNKWGTVPLQGYGTLDRIARAKPPTSVYYLEVMADAPLRWWRLQETAGTVMVDSSGNAGDGTFDFGVSGLNHEALVYGEEPYITFDGERWGSMPLSGSVPTTGIEMSAEFVCTLDAIPAIPADGMSYYALLVGPGDTSHNQQKIYVQVDTSSAGTRGITMQNRGPAGIGGRRFRNLDAPGPYHAFLRANNGVFTIFLIDAEGIVYSGDVSRVPGSPTGDRVDVGGTKPSASVDGIVPFVGAMGEVAIYNTHVSDARVAAHQAAFWAPWDGDTADERITKLASYMGLPADRLDLEPCQTVLGPASFANVSRMIDAWWTLEDSEDGQLHEDADGVVRLLDRYYPYMATEAITPQLVLSDVAAAVIAGTAMPYQAPDLLDDDELIVNIARGNRIGGATVEERDTTGSIGLYGENDATLSNLATASDTAVRSLLDHLIATRNTPQARYPELRVPMHELTATQQGQLLDLKIGHRITVNRTPQGVGSATSLDFLVQGIDHDIPQAGEWWVVLYASLAPAATSFWKWGTGRWGQTTVWAY